jgi:DNA-binding SARP family transcriptional activator/tetratricopeptide (TPR) repeat protein
MDFRLLGPLEVQAADGTPLPLGGRKQRGVLAVLLLRPNEVVPVDRIVDDLWGASPPRTVQAYVQNCMSRLRTVLGHALIETHSPGYRLRVDTGAIDAHRFEAAVRTARELETPERAARLTEALQMWRGAALADFEFEPFAQAEIARLDELRISAIEARLEAELELGHHDAFLAELDALVLRHPTRERLRALQMLALYRSGRQRDALAAYQQARTELVEVGLEPGEDLRALERLILTQDASLRAPTSVREERGRRHRIVLAAGAELTTHDDAFAALLTAAQLDGTNLPMVIDRAPIDPHLLASTAPGDLILGTSVLPLVAHAVDVVPHPGGGHRVIAIDTNADALPRRYDTPLVGREAELAELDRRFRSVDPVGLVVVSGDAGIGKTRLVQELAARLGGEATVLNARCSPYPQRLGALEQLIEAVGAPVLAGGDRAEELWAIRRLFETVALERPLVLVLDDVQWADAELLDAVDYLTGWSRGPMLIVSVGRPEVFDARPEWRAAALWLNSLNEAESVELAASVPGSRKVDTGLVAKVAEGNPFFVEQLVTSLSTEAVEIPATVEALIADRIEQLAPEEQRVLERAAVVGTSLWRGAVEAATPAASRADIGRILISLVRKRFLRPDASVVAGEDGFRFQHALIREVVYGRLGADDRAQLHLRIGRSLAEDDELELVAAYHLEQAAPFDSGARQEATDRLGAAGLRALRRFDLVVASELVRRALALSPAEALELEWADGTIMKFRGDPAGADVVLERVATRAAEEGDTEMELRARIEQVWWSLAQGRIAVADAFALLTRAVDVVEDDFTLGRAWDLTSAIEGVYRRRAWAGAAAEEHARLHYIRAGFTSGASAVRLAGAAHIGATPVPDAIKRCEQLIADSEAPVWSSFILPFLASLHSMAGRFDQARVLFERARETRAEFADPGTLATSWTALAAQAELTAGRPDRAELILTEALPELEARGDVEWLATNGALLAEVELLQGNHETALVMADRVLAHAPLGHLMSRACAARVRAVALARTGSTAEGVACAEDAVRALAESDSLSEQGHALLALSAALEAAGRRDEARARRQEARAAFAAKGETAAIARLDGS